jgi:hypothetical protein
MGPSWKDFRDRLLDEALEYLWREWSTLGVPGYGDDSGESVIDPEALLAFTCTFGRYDARLFDAVLDWLAVNGRFINLQRFRGMFKHGGFAGQQVANAVIATMQLHTSSAKWRVARETATAYGTPEPMFRFTDGRPLPVPGERDPEFLTWGLTRNPVHLRGLTRSFPHDHPSALLLRIRALFGVSARCEILAYLLCKGPGHSYGIARSTGYFQKTVYDALSDMERSGFLVSSRTGRERTYKLDSTDLVHALSGDVRPPQWNDWSRFLAALERLWLESDQTHQLHSGNAWNDVACHANRKDFLNTVAGLDMGTAYPFEWIRQYHSATPDAGTIDSTN